MFRIVLSPHRHRPTARTRRWPEQRRAVRAMHRAAVQLHQVEPFQVHERQRVERSLAHVDRQVWIAARTEHAPPAVEGATVHARSLRSVVFRPPRVELHLLAVCVYRFQLRREGVRLTRPGEQVDHAPGRAARQPWRDTHPARHVARQPADRRRQPVAGRPHAALFEVARAGCPVWRRRRPPQPRGEVGRGRGGRPRVRRVWGHLARRLAGQCCEMVRE